MNKRFFTNRRGKTPIDKFAGVFSNNPDIRFFDEVVDISALRVALPSAHTLPTLKKSAFLSELMLTSAPPGVRNAACFSTSPRPPPSKPSWRT